MKTKLVGAGVLAIAAAMFLGGALSPLRVEGSDADSPSPAADGLDAASSLGPGAEAAPIGALVKRVDDDGDNAAHHAQLGLAYLQRARSQADPSHLPDADEALRRSLALQPHGNLEAFVGMASLANARHDFSNSLSWSRRAVRTNPFNAAAYGLLGDALFELGRVRAADAAYQKMVDVRPDVGSFVRVSYALQYHGRTGAAIDAMRLALQAAGPTGETAAWVRHQMGDIYAGLGKNRRAAQQNRIGIALAPGYVPPTVGLAESFIARGRLDEAVEIMERAADALPSLEYTITLGDLYRATGREDEAIAQYREVATTLGEYRRAGVLPDADFIVFYADQGLRRTAALGEAFAIYRDRPTVETADALAWMLHSVGRDREAWRYARKVIGETAADSAMLFHAGTIASARGDEGRAIRLMRRALSFDPTFSPLQAPIARRVARL